MRDTRSASVPYSSGCDGNSTTPCFRRLLPGEYGTRRSVGESVILDANSHSAPRLRTNRVIFSSGSSTISTISPSPRTADAVGTLIFFSCGSWSEFIGEMEALQGIERLMVGFRLFAHHERDDVAVLAAAEAVVGVCLGVDGEGGPVVFMEGTTTNESAAYILEIDDPSDDLH